MMPMTFVPVGVVLPYAGKLAKGDDTTDAIAQIRTNLWTAGWLFCDGSRLSANEYATLFGVIGYAFGGSAGSFQLPDLRGQFIRGVSETLEQDRDREKRTPAGGKDYTAVMVGSVQADAFQEHQHHYDSSSAKGTANSEGPEILYYVPDPSKLTAGYAADPANPLPPDEAKPRTSTETRPVNLYLNYIIRFRPEPPFF